MFHKTNPRLKTDWFELKAGAKLDAALAVTRDQAATEGADPIHYTVAPKDDMSLALFLQYLRALGDQATPS